MVSFPSYNIKTNEVLKPCGTVSNAGITILKYVY